MAGKRDSAPVMLAEWGPPESGVWRTLPIHKLPPQALYNADNVAFRNGEIQRRSGLVSFGTPIAPSERITGGHYFPRTGVYATTLFGTNTKLYYLSDTNTLVDVTGTPALTGQTFNLNQFTTIVFGSPATAYIFQTNGVDTPREWNGSAATFTVCSCNPPKFTDVVTAFDRIVGIIPPYTVRWGEARSLSQWPELNARNLIDTEDPVVAIRTLGTMNVIVYKERSIWSGMARGGSSAQAFSFELRGIYDGPANPSAICAADNAHYYMTKEGRIAAYDGRTHQWVGDGVWGMVKAVIDQTKAYAVSAVYDSLNHEVVFSYPLLSDSTPSSGVVVLSLPRPQFGIRSFGCWPGGWKYPVSGAVLTKLASGADKVLVYTDNGTARQISQLTPASPDLDQAFNCSWQSGMVPAPELGIMRPELETFAVRAAMAGNLTAKIASSYILDTTGGTLSAGETISLANVEPVEKKAFSATKGRFFGYHYSCTSADVLNWRGALLSGRKVEE